MPVWIENLKRVLPKGSLLFAFTPEHLQKLDDPVEVGRSVLIVGFPLGFHDTLHHLPVVRQSIIASAFGLRFQGQGYFLTDARMHRGTSGSPINPPASAATPPKRTSDVAAMVAYSSIRQAPCEKPTRMMRSLGIPAART